MLEIQYDYPSCRFNHTIKIRTGHMLHPESPAVDPLSCALHALTLRCQNLKKVVMLGAIIISPDVFWPAHDCNRGDDNATDSPIWPSMEEYSVSMNIVTPTGGCYYRRDPNGICPVWLDSAEFHPLLRAISRAVRRMPKIRKFVVELEPGCSCQYIVGVVAAGPGMSVAHRPTMMKDGTDVRRWYVFVGSETEWGPSNVEGDIRAMWDEWVGPAGIARVVVYPTKRRRV
ncbi:hypothetical protein BDZ91DRAFT_749800 [Kalaharituber pfeilii]|nr:hypothetical protein BDZ91DRAFT_749800 [Kalaharituber pfeilii]